MSSRQRVPSTDPRPASTGIASIAITKSPVSNFGADTLTATPNQAQQMFLNSIQEWRALVTRARMKPEG